MKAGEDEQLGTLEGVGEMIKRPANERLDQQQLISNKTCTKKMATHRGFQGQVWMGVRTKKAGFQCFFASSNLPVLDAK